MGSQNPIGFIVSTPHFQCLGNLRLRFQVSFPIQVALCRVVVGVATAKVMQKPFIWRQSREKSAFRY